MHILPPLTSIVFPLCSPVVSEVNASCSRIAGNSLAGGATGQSLPPLGIDQPAGSVFLMLIGTSSVARSTAFDL